MISKDMIGNISGVLGLIILIMGAIQFIEETKTNAMTQTSQFTFCIALPFLLLFLALASTPKPPLEEE